jgi:dihydroorotate dehydrogenase
MLRFYRLTYHFFLRPLIFQLFSAQDAHTQAMTLLARCDISSVAQKLAIWLRHTVEIQQPVNVGGVQLDSPLILAAGFVKGLGFAFEQEATEAEGNIIPGWRTMPNLVGAVEFGSFTRYPRLGNPGTVIWRDVPTQSTQNRVGLKNPGACAAAKFLKRHLPPTPFGVNIAVSPGVEDAQQEEREILEAAGAFLQAEVFPGWMTLNLSCPNTEDDPSGHQSAEKAERLCGALVEALTPFKIPLWVKVSPGLSEMQYRELMRSFTKVGVRAVIATNTLAQPTPDDSGMVAGVGGGKLHQEALRATTCLVEEKQRLDCNVDVIGCGGLLDYQTYQAFRQAGAAAVQYWSALVYEGPLAFAVISRKDL